MIKVISKDIIEINPGEVVVEITVIERLFWINFKQVFRKVHGAIFRYKNGRYRKITWRDSGVENYFKLPIE
tara:strand:- start:26873 stop:27085 length:213 start_codon:yes stop_codon:yes gene_type:complete